MVFSKSFGYALRGVLYVAVLNEEKKKIQLDEIAEVLTVPRYFLGKVMRLMAKEGIVDSEKGHNGGFSINETTLQTSLLTIVSLTEGIKRSDSCVLRFRKCNTHNPCPMHNEIESLRKQWTNLLATTVLGDLMKKDAPDFIRSIATV